MPNYLPLRGNTYPVRQRLAALGAYWNGAAWMVPEERMADAMALLGRRPQGHAASAGFRPSGEQAALLTFLKTTGDNLFVEAGAGCGKTTTALWLLGHLDGRKAMVAFNVEIKNDIQDKASSDTEVVTMNALGHRAIRAAYNLRDVNVDGDWFIAEMRRKLDVDVVRLRYAYYKGCKRLYEIARGALAETREEIENLAVDFEVDFSVEDAAEELQIRTLREAAELVLETMTARANDRTPPTSIDFVDQLWLPVVRSLPLPQYDVLVIDEAQDTNAVQVEMLARCVTRGRVIAVGDRRQAIYQFRGADERAVDAIIERFGATRMPLMTTFRCGKKIVAEAQKIVPYFVAGESNPDGVVRDVKGLGYLNEVRVGDFVISRTNAPLVRDCIALLADGIPAVVVGRDVGSTLLKIAKKMKAKSIEEFRAKLDAWADKEIATIKSKIPVNDAAIDAIEDRRMCLDALAASVDTVAALHEKIENLFTDTKSDARVEFSTTHKAKGRERDRVFVIRDTFCRARLNKATGEYEAPGVEEENLLYVAITRAKTELVYVHGTEKRRRGH